jgi:membrane associated rhomboid family serine protease
VVRWLLVSNIGIFLLDTLFLNHRFINFGAFAVRSAIYEGRVWEFITFQFLHASLLHVMFNCIGIYFFGPWMERWWGSRKFAFFYLLCGVGGAAFFTLLTFLELLPGGMIASMVGASAGIYGIFIGVAFIAPNLRVMLLFPPIELSMRQLAIALLVISASAIILGIGGNEGGEAGHLGGAILGFVLMRFPWLLGGPPGITIVRPRCAAARHEAKLGPRTEIELQEDNAVDEILDKISRDGFQSLTAAEKEILRKASERKHSDP